MASTAAPFPQKNVPVHGMHTKLCRWYDCAPVSVSAAALPVWHCSWLGFTMKEDATQSVEQGRHTGVVPGWQPQDSVAAL